ncbi:MAG: DUF4347 domain-containing protein [Gammaproteobacteria bacterium]
MKSRNGKLWIGAVALFTVSVFTFATIRSYASVTPEVLLSNHSDSAFHSPLRTAKQASLKTATSLIIVDESVDDYRSLLLELTDSKALLKPEVLVLDRKRDGIRQITERLAQSSAQYDSVHIISHALSGEVQLGNSILKHEVLDTYLDELTLWREALSEDADILFYGCELAASESGKHFAQILSQMTQADVAASTNLTGSNELGGDWVLETTYGRIETRALSAQNWKGVLTKLVINPIDFPIRESDGMVSGEPGPPNNMSLDFAEGESAIWVNAGTADGQPIDVKATVVTLTDNSGDNSGAVSFSTRDDDLWLQLYSAEAVIKWEIFVSGGGQSVIASGNPQFIISDIDGNGSGSAFPALQIEAVLPDVSSLTSFTLSNPTNLEAGVQGNQVYVRGTQSENGGQTSLVAFDWSSVTEWTITYQAVVGGGVRFFLHDGDGDLTFSSPVTTSFLSLDLDSNDSTVAGNNFLSAVYDEGGAAVVLADTDTAISVGAPLNSTLDSARVEISNSYPNDELLVNGSTATSGNVAGGASLFTYTNTVVDGDPVVVITGSGSLPDYAAALQAVSFRNSSTSLYGDTRIIEMTVTDDEQSTTSNVALAIVNINPDIDDDTYLNDVDLDDDNDGVLDTAETPSDPMADGDADGYPAYLDDDDGDASIGNEDGVAQIEFDADLDGIPNHWDLDSDNDGIPDNIEAQSSAGYLPPDNAYDAFGVDTAYSGGLSSPVDKDGDLTDDMLDTDSDGDGIGDTTEAGLSLGSISVGLNGLDDDVDTADDYVDVNGEFDSSPLNDLPDVDNPGGEPDWRDPQDFDLDTFAGNVDIDDDGDGITDANETGIVDTSNFDNGDLSFSGEWRDNSFFASGFLGVVATEGEEYLFASNSDVGLGDTFGTASGLLNTSSWVEGQTTFSIDVSFPNLGVSQLAEFTFKVFSGTVEVGELTGVEPVFDGTSIYSLLVHLSTEQIASGISLELTVPKTGDNALVVFDNLQVVGNLDFDGDGVADSHDLDSDNDGIPDNVEAQLTASYQAPADNDADSDGLDDNYEFAGDVGLTAVNSDSSGQPDYLDTDSDNDSISDTREAGLFLGVLEVGVNGWDDDAEVADNYADVNGVYNTPASDLPDADGDALSGGDVNYREQDSDDDGISDGDEDMALALPTPVGDTNSNDVDDSVDVAFTGGSDFNLNGVDDAFELTDTDGDTVPNYADLDSDNDGLFDSVEGNANSDSDGVPDFLDLDSDNDGLPDNVEAQSTSGYIMPASDEANPSGYSVAANGVNTAYVGGLTPVNTDGTDTPDYIDSDSDNDGDEDTGEAGLMLNTLNVGVNGLDDDVEVQDDFMDVNGTVVQGALRPDDLPNADGAGDVDFRALTVPVVNMSASASSTPVVSGSHDSDASLSVTVNLVTYTEGDGSLTDTGSDTWSLAIPSALTDGTYEVVATSVLGPLSATDTSSNELIVDTVLPVINAVDLGPVSNSAPTLSGTTSADSGLTVTVTDENNLTVCTAVVVFSDPNSWECSPEGGLADGTYTLEAAVTNGAGSTATDLFTVEIDVTAPVVSGNDAGPTLDKTPTLSGGSGEPEGSSVFVTDASGGSVCSATVAVGIEENTWSCTPAADLSAGTSVLTVSSTDEAGNTGTDTFNVVITSLSPEITIDAIAIDDVIDGVEDDSDLIISGGSADAQAESVAVSVNGNTYVTTTNPSNGKWKVTVPTADVKLFSVAESVNAELTGPAGEAAEGASRLVTRDGDVDNDGIPDQIEAGVAGQLPIDTDGDSIPDYLDLDSDNDGIADAVEERLSVGSDADGDGIDDAFDVDSFDGGVDSNADGILDGIVLSDADQDGVRDNLDLDSDNDGIPDIVEAQSSVGFQSPGPDNDGNGLADNYESSPSAGDGLQVINTDGTDLPDYLDADSDNDGITDSKEAGVSIGELNTGANGLDDDLEADDTYQDPDGLFDPALAGYFNDTDGDANGSGERDYRDTDSDGDSIPDTLEAGSDTATLRDTDSDGIPDFLDTDSDGDGIGDLEESGMTTAMSGEDTNGNGIDDNIDATFIDGTDANENGVDDSFEPGDLDRDGIADYLDLDADNDGAPDVLEGAVDSDGDGISDYQDFDSDGDGILDAVEYAITVEASGSDADGDGIDDAFDADLVGSDTNDNGVDDAAEPVDTDGDGLSDGIDIDADGDGLVDNLEAQSTNRYLAPSGEDVDADGLDDVYDANTDVQTNDVESSVGLDPFDLNGQAGPDYLSVDSDGDGMSDTQEAYGAIEATDTDTDEDGLDDAFDDYDNSVTPDLIANVTNNSQQSGAATWRDGNDADGDGIDDFADTDDDNDGIPDSVENINSPTPSGNDTDQDGIDDAIDVDQTGGEDINSDGIDDAFALSDEDGDGIPNSFDLDADNDGINDRLEIGANPSVPLDTDGDGKPDYLDTDSDNDGLPDRIENRFGPELSGNDEDGDGIDDVLDVDLTLGVDANGDGADDALAPVDTDGDGRADFIDADSDNDGAPDVVEAGASPALTGADSDGDGIDDAFDVDVTGGVDADADGIDDLTQPVDTNRDGIPDHLTTDSDTDGISDTVEADALLTDSDGDGIFDSYDITVTGGFDINGDGVDDNVSPTDTDGDSIPDYLDIDSDNDGLSDVTEAGLPDSNGDGIVDAGQETDEPVNTDNDDLPDFRDLDSDNDGVTDLRTAGLMGLDADNNGVIDDVTDVDGDGVPDSIDGQPGAFSSGRDFDGDGIADIVDLDSDNDGIANVIEAPDGRFGLDTDGDGIPDYLDLDSDNDGVSDFIEAAHNLVDIDGDGQVDDIVDSNGDGIDDQIEAGFVPDDSDSDDVPDYQDLDSDGDSISDLLESGVSAELDSNNDGMIDQVALGDSDFDGFLDVVDVKVALGEPGSAIDPVDTDGDGTPDYKDLDSDGDAVMDQAESGDNNGDGVPDRLQIADAAAPTPETTSSSGGGSGSLGVWMLMLLLTAALRRRYSRDVRLRASHSERNSDAQFERFC